MNQINNSKLYCQPFWNQIVKRQQGQSQLRRRDVLAKHRPPCGCLLYLTKILLKYYSEF
ncbi:MAG: hypothetical protein LBL62_03970 [Planctomycetaceae bacterium]|nr:hypothetical protein [Planctomycetaceae bacterium]